MIDPGPSSLAEIDPAAVYASPRDVLADHRLTTGDKVRILHRWEYNAANAAHGEARKRASKTGVTRQQILLAIDGLALIIDMAAIPPAKRAYQTHQAVLRDKTRS